MSLPKRFRAVTVAVVGGLAAAIGGAESQAIDRFKPLLQMDPFLPPKGGDWVYRQDWRTVDWSGDDCASAVHRRTQAHSLAIEAKFDRWRWSYLGVLPRTPMLDYVPYQIEKCD